MRTTPMPQLSIARLLNQLAGLLDSMVLTLAVAAPFEQGEVLDMDYVETMVLVVDEYVCRRSDGYRRVVERT
jgi:hypothetical protein